MQFRITRSETSLKHLIILELTPSSNGGGARSGSGVIGHPLSIRLITPTVPINSYLRSLVDVPLSAGFDPLEKMFSAVANLQK